MAKLMLIGNIANVELTTDPEDGQVIATCAVHSLDPEDKDGLMPCSWTERYDDLGDASEYAADHADRGGPAWVTTRSTSSSNAISDGT